MGMVLCDALLRRADALLMFQAKKQFQIGPTGRGKTVCMNDHTRLRDGHVPHGELEGSMAAVAFAAEPVVPAQAPGTGIYAALDLGTNNCRLLIACPTSDGFRVVDSFSRIIRPGEGISATGCISDSAIERAIAALNICRDKIHYTKAQRLRLIDPGACRAASNAD